MIFTGALIAGITLLKLNNPYTGLSVIWAFAGIAIKRQEDYRTVFISAVIAMSLIALVTVWGFIRQRIL